MHRGRGKDSQTFATEPGAKYPCLGCSTHILTHHETVLLQGESIAAVKLMLHESQSRGIYYDTGPSSYLVVMRQNNQGWPDFLCGLLNDYGNVCCITVDSVCKEMKIPLYTSFVQFVLYPVQVGVVSSVNTQCACKNIFEPEAGMHMLLH